MHRIDTNTPLHTMIPVSIIGADALGHYGKHAYSIFSCAYFAIKSPRTGKHILIKHYSNEGKSNRAIEVLNKIDCDARYCNKCAKGEYMVFALSIEDLIVLWQHRAVEHDEK